MYILQSKLILHKNNKETSIYNSGGVRVVIFTINKPFLNWLKCKWYYYMSSMKEILQANVLVSDPLHI